jgi:hypothetical protein
MAAWAGGIAWPGGAALVPPTFESIPNARQAFEVIRLAQQRAA